MKFLGHCFVSLVIFLLLGLTIGKGQETPDCFEHGECMNSLVLDFWHNVEGAQACLERCQENSDCEFFTFYEEDNSCLAFLNCGAFSTNSCSYCYSGERSCEGLECWVDGLCNGVLIGETFDVDKNSCLEECQVEENCSWFTHDSNGDICLMFQDCPALDASCTTCLSSQRQCSQFVEELTDYTKLLVIGGYNSSGYLAAVEVVDLENPESICSPIQDYPRKDTGMAVGLVDGLVKSCGGEYDTDYCYDYDPATKSWSNSTSLLNERLDPKASSIDGFWLVSGDGRDSDDVGHSTELWTGSGFEQGPYLPLELLYHCQLTVNSTHVFFADTYETGISFLLDLQAQTSTELPQMTQHTVLPSCGMIYNPDNGPEAVILDEGSSEIFNFANMTWRIGPGMRSTFRSAGSAQIGDTFVVVGGRNTVGDHLDAVYQFDHLNYRWMKKGNLQAPRTDFPGVVAVPDDFVSCS